MGAEIKFCGLTRAEDAEFAVQLGASYVGVIFAGGPRMLTVEQATEVFAGVPESTPRAGVFADQTVAEIARAAESLRLSVVQLHIGADVERIEAIRRVYSGRVWAACRVAGQSLPSNVRDVMDAADGLLLDAYVPGALGGTGVALPWEAVARELRDVRDAAKPVILAGGLRPENVATAIAAMAPDVVDVSSGVERAPGIKDHDRMRAFRDAVEASAER